MSRLLPALVFLTGCGGFEAPVVDELSDAEVCESVETWEGDWAALEEEMVLAISAARGEGGVCGDAEFGANAPLVEPSGPLRCAARLHARDLADLEALVHTGSDGSTPLERIQASGYDGVGRGEILARATRNVEQTLDAFLASPEHCAALLERNLDEVGVGLWVRSGTPYWVVTLGTRVEEP